jgi:monoamine oxidase
MVTKIQSTATDVVVTSLKTADRSTLPDGHYSFLILATPPTVWRDIDLAQLKPQLPEAIHCGPAVKYLFYNVDSRYWVTQGHAPSGDDDELGQLWESTENQMFARDIGLTIFAGGQYAKKVPSKDPDTYFLKGLEKLLPGAKDHVVLGEDGGKYVDWPNEPYIKCGYCGPKRGQVTGLQQHMQRSFGAGGRIFLAGEHCSPPFFGFMEGALQSGVQTAWRVADAAPLIIPHPPKKP